MSRTVTVEEAKSRTGYELVQEAAQTHQPLIVTLENGATVSIQQYQPAAKTTDELLALKPLLTLPGSVPPGWKNAIYDEQH